MNGLIEWVVFLALSGIAIITAAGMIITMSMYRAGLALMASFVALAGLFILLNADLLAAIQVMMNVGGMLVMVLFMVMMMMDPGGEMMWGMKRDMHMRGPGAFSMHMPWGKLPEDDQPEQAKDWTCPMHPEISEQTVGSCPKCGMALIPRAEATNEQPMHDMNMSDMAGVHEMNMTGMTGIKDIAKTYACPMHPEVQQDQPGTCPKCGMTLVEQAKAESEPEHTMSTQPAHHESHQGHESNDKPQPEHAMHMSNHDMSMHEMHEMSNMSHMEGMDGMSEMGGMSMTPRQNYDMMVDMAMSTAQLPWAIVLGILAALLLIVLVIFTPWPLANIQPTQDATTAVGQLLLSRYMIGFEGAAFLILAGIAGAVLLGKRERPEAKKNQMPSVEEGASETDASNARSTMDTSTSDTQVYTCPMHPDIRQSQPGKCPKCGMSLIPVDAGASEQSHMMQGGHS